MPTLQKIKMYYDPLGRVVKTVNPDRSEQRVVYGVPNNLNTPGNFAPTPWENFTYDANDLAPITNPNNNPVPSTQWYTPKSTEVDALGRNIKTTEHKVQYNGSTYEDVVMKYEYDIQGNLIKVTDPYNRKVFEHKYDLQKTALYTKHIDGGISTLIIDATAKPIEGNDAKDARTLTSYDTLQRPVNTWAKNNSADTDRLVSYNRYGEEEVNPALNNLNGKLWEQYDEAGKQEMSSYDFKGNLLNKKRNVIKDAVLKPELENYEAYLVDWTNLPDLLDAFDYETTNEYDALNRVTKITLPEDVNTDRKEIIPEYNRAGALEKVKYDGDEYVKHIAYNAKGQRLLIAFGNEIMTRYAYDTFTFRLLRQRSEKYTYSQTGNTITYAYNAGTNKQDDKYNYDLIGNILEINIRTTACGVGGTNSLDRTFEYDPLYRLTNATGRENVQGGSYPFPGWQDLTRNDTPNTTVAYTRNYAYDKLGNIEEMQQVGTNAFTRTFNYISNTNKLNTVSIGANSYSYTYDNCGNQLTENSNRKFEWDAANRLLFFKNQAGISEPSMEAQYLYDSAGNRVKKIVRKQGGDYEICVYIDGVFEFYTDETDTQNTVHIMDDTSRIATVRIGDAMGDATPAVKYVLEDNIGSSMAVLDDTGAFVNTQEYYPFGETSFGSYGKKRYQYVGKERDEESGLYYYGARYYSPWICRFFALDPLAADYAHLSPFNYASNNPVNYVDVDGMQNPDEGNSEKGGNPPVVNSPSNPIVLDEVDVTATQGGSKEWQGFLASHDLYKMRDSYSFTKLNESLNSWFMKGKYGTDNYGQAAIPKETQSSITEAANKEFLPALKEYWAQEKSGGDYLTYMYWKALTVTEKEEGQRMVNEVALSVGTQWLLAVMPQIVELGMASKTTQASTKLMGAELPALEIKAPFSFANPASFEGAAAEDVIKYFEELGWTKSVANKGEGAIRFADPSRKGVQYIIQPKGFSGGDPMHSGPYLKASGTGGGDKVRIMLKR